MYFRLLLPPVFGSCETFYPPIERKIGRYWVTRNTGFCSLRIAHPRGLLRDKIGAEYCLTSSVCLITNRGGGMLNNPYLPNFKTVLALSTIMLRLFTSPAEEQNRSPRLIDWGLLVLYGTRITLLKAHTCRLLVARVLVRAHRAIEELVLVQVDFEERRPLLDLPRDQCLRERILNVPLQRAAQGARPVAAIGQRLLHNPLLGVVVH